LALPGKPVDSASNHHRNHEKERTIGGSDLGSLDLAPQHRELMA